MLSSGWDKVGIFVHLDILLGHWAPEEFNLIKDHYHGQLLIIQYKFIQFVSLKYFCIKGFLSAKDSDLFLLKIN